MFHVRSFGFGADFAAVFDEADDKHQVYTLMYSSGTAGVPLAGDDANPARPFTKARPFDALSRHCLARGARARGASAIGCRLAAGGAPKAVATPKSTWRKTNCTPGPLGGISDQADRRAVSYLSMSHGADRGITWFTTIAGGRTGLITEPAGSDEFFAAMRELRPTFFLGFSCFWQDMFHRHAQRLRSAVSSALQPRLGSNTLSAVQWAQLEAAFIRTRRGQAIAQSIASLAREELGGALMLAATGAPANWAAMRRQRPQRAATDPGMKVRTCAAHALHRWLAHTSGSQVFHSALHDRGQ
jgi:hypothetical protein